MGDKADETTTATQVTGVELGLVIDRAELAALGLAQDATASALIEAFKTHRQNAVQVTAYRDDAINEAVIEGKRAIGEHFNEERQRKMLASLDIPDITAQRREWATMAKATFATGRQTEEKADLEPKQERQRQPAQTRRAAPMGAYRPG